MARVSIETDRSTFLSALPKGQSVGNMRLRTELGWRDERYWRVHSSLVDAGQIVKGRGRGGSVLRVAKSRKN